MLSLDELCVLPVSELVAEDAHLHLWATNSQLFAAPQLMSAWGFEFKSCLVWVRPQRGRGEFWRIAHEFLLLGTRGELPFRDRSLISWVRVNRSKQSRKPEKIRKLVERVSPGPYLELFGDAPVKGWTVGGSDTSSSP